MNATLSFTATLPSDRSRYLLGLSCPRSHGSLMTEPDQTAELAAALVQAQLAQAKAALYDGAQEELAQLKEVSSKQLRENAALKRSVGKLEEQLSGWLPPTAFARLHADIEAARHARDAAAEGAATAVAAAVAARHAAADAIDALQAAHEASELRTSELERALVSVSSAARTARAESEAAAAERDAAVAEAAEWRARHDALEREVGEERRQLALYEQSESELDTALDLAARDPSVEAQRAVMARIALGGGACGGAAVTSIAQRRALQALDYARRLLAAEEALAGERDGRAAAQARAEAAEAALLLLETRGGRAASDEPARSDAAAERAAALEAELAECRADIGRLLDSRASLAAQLRRSLLPEPQGGECVTRQPCN